MQQFPRSRTRKTCRIRWLQPHPVGTIALPNGVQGTLMSKSLRNMLLPKCATARNPLRQPPSECSAIRFTTSQRFPPKTSAGTPKTSTGTPTLLQGARTVTSLCSNLINSAQSNIYHYSLISLRDHQLSSTVLIPINHFLTAYPKTQRTHTSNAYPICLDSPQKCA